MNFIYGDKYCSGEKKIGELETKIWVLEIPTITRKHLQEGSFGGCIFIFIQGLRQRVTSVHRVCC